MSDILSEDIQRQIASDAMHQNFLTGEHARMILSEQNDPYLLMKARLSKDGDQFCFLYGENIQEGIAGFGETPAKAALAFNREWWGIEEKK